jgi:hypothetical protein
MWVRLKGDRIGWCRVDTDREAIEHLKEDIWDIQNDLWDIKHKLKIKGP